MSFSHTFFTFYHFHWLQYIGLIKILFDDHCFIAGIETKTQHAEVYIMFTDTRFDDVVAEIQLVHETFVVPWPWCGAALVY